jgi:uncharacterized protein (TIGR02391 family)
MPALPCLSPPQVETLSRLLGECGTGSEISSFFVKCGFTDESGHSTKWRRIEWVFLDRQRKDGCANAILGFVQQYLAPARYVGRIDEFNSIRTQLNTILAFSGLQYGADGQFRSVSKAATLDEAEMRAKTLRSKFQGRAIHSEVIRYCRAELLQDNYFHAVFEASKGLAQRIRDLSGAHGDGAVLVDRVFSVERPLLAFSTLQTESERSEHKGFAMLLKGCFGAIRNPLAHEPKLLWTGEEDAADYLSFISLLHRRLDDCFSTGLD